MIKWVIRLALVVVVLLIVLAISGVVYIDSAARRAVEVAATRSLGVDTKLGSMSVGIATSSVTLGDLEVANPAGYTSPHFLKLDSGKVAVSLNTLMKDQVVVPELTLEGVDVYLEKKDGKANYQVIMDNLGLDQPVPPEEQKKYIINELNLKNITVHASLLPVGGSLTNTKIHIPEIKLKDVGSDTGGGILLGDLTEVIVKAIMQAIVDKSGELPATIVAELGAGLGKLEDIQARSLEVIGGASNEIQKGIGEASKSINKAAEGLGNLLGGKKESSDTPKESEQKN